jgi:predicted SAM-dependent methyltransferase
MVKLDLGCGINKKEGFLGVDIEKFDGVDVVADLTKKWPWTDESVEEVHCSHVVEHLTGKQRIHFFNELYRVLKKGGKATVIVPHWTFAGAYGDPTHQWPPMSEWAWLYLNAEWRKGNAPHVGYKCNFNVTSFPTHDGRLNGRNQEYQQFAFSNYINNWRDMVANLIKE